MEEKKMTIRINEELYKNVKINVLQKNTTVKDYITKLILDDLEKDEKKDNKK